MISINDKVYKKLPHFLKMTLGLTALETLETFSIPPPLFHSFLQKEIFHLGKLDEWKSGAEMLKLFPNSIPNSVGKEDI